MTERSTAQKVVILKILEMENGMRLRTQSKSFSFIIHIFMRNITIAVFSHQIWSEKSLEVYGCNEFKNKNEKI